MSIDSSMLYNPEDKLIYIISRDKISVFNKTVFQYSFDINPPFENFFDSCIQKNTGNIVLVDSKRYAVFSDKKLLYNVFFDKPKNILKIDSDKKGNFRIVEYADNRRIFNTYCCSTGKIIYTEENNKSFTDEIMLEDPEEFLYRSEKIFFNNNKTYYINQNNMENFKYYKGELYFTCNSIHNDYRKTIGKLNLKTREVTIINCLFLADILFCIADDTIYFSYFFNLESLGMKKL